MSLHATNRNSRIAWLLCCVCCCSHCCVAQAEQVTTTSRVGLVELTTTLSNDAVQVAEPFTLELRLEAPTGYRVSVPEFGEALGVADIIDVQRTADIPAGSSRRWLVRLELETLRSGDIELPAIDFVFQGEPRNAGIDDGEDADGEVDDNAELIDGASTSSPEVGTISTGKIPVRVSSVLEETDEPNRFRDIQPVVDVPVTNANTPYLTLVIAGSAASGLGLVMGIWLLRRGKGPKPETWALGQLDALALRIERRQVSADVAIPQVADIMRDYLRLKLPEQLEFQTTQEIVAMTADQRFGNQEITDRVTEVLELADKVKYAGGSATQADLETTLRAARQVVELTEAARGVGGPAT